jgi:hypothetical protein
LNETECLQEIYNILLDFYDDDIEMVNAWMETMNPNLGGISPNTMVKLGRHEKLLQMMQVLISENYDD